MSTVFNCPQCGRQLKVIQLAGTGEAAGGGWQAGQRFAFGKLPPGTSEYSRETPTANLASTEAGVKMPLLQALVSGGVALMLAVVVALWRGSRWWGRGGDQRCSVRTGLVAAAGPVTPTAILARDRHDRPVRCSIHGRNNYPHRERQDRRTDGFRTVCRQTNARPEVCPGRR